jgi:signal peptidase II
VLVPLALAFVALVFLRSRHLGAPRVLGLALLTGGGLGNWLDRLLHSGAVVDFVSLGLGSLRTGIFNVADVAIVAGALLLALGPLRRAPSEETP